MSNMFWDSFARSASSHSCKAKWSILVPWSIIVPFTLLTLKMKIHFKIHGQIQWIVTWGTIFEAFLTFIIIKSNLALEEVRGAVIWNSYKSIFNSYVNKFDSQRLRIVEHPLMLSKTCSRLVTTLQD